MVAFVKYFMLPGLENLWNEPLKCNDLGDYSFGTSYSTVTNLYKHWINQFLYVKSFSRIVHGYDATVVDVTVVLWLKPCCVNICWLFSWRICLQKKNVQCSNCWHAQWIVTLSTSCCLCEVLFIILCAQLANKRKQLGLELNVTNRMELLLRRAVSVRLPHFLCNITFNLSCVLDRNTKKSIFIMSNLTLCGCKLLWQFFSS